MNRRDFLHMTLAAAGSATLNLPANAADAASAAAQAHAEIWRRFVDKHGVMIDFAGLDGAVTLPTPDECRAGQPNALGWFQPIENGAMFNGLYMDAALSRWRVTQAPADAEKARRLMEGLLFLNSLSEVKGFVARGVSTDGKAHYPMGSDDQTTPWFVGLWRYWEAPFATPDEKARIARQLRETAEVIIAARWRIPAEAPFNFRGGFGGGDFGKIVRRLFVLRLLHRVTGEAKWDELYRAELQTTGKNNETLRAICAHGMEFTYAKTHNWTSCCEVACLRALWELETEPETKTLFARGLANSARLAAESLPLYARFDNNDKSAFNLDWRRAMLPLWKPQNTEGEAVDLALAQLREFMKISPRRHPEAAFIREPTSAAWIVALCPDAALVKGFAPTIEKLIAHYDYANLYYCTFFWAEAAWWRLRGF